MTGDATEPDWGDPPRRPRLDAAPVLTVDGFEGPLDWLLELVRSERIDLRRLSILALVDAFVAALDEGLAAPRADLARWGDWLGMAAHLTLLRSRLLLPADAAEARSAQQEAEALRRRLLDGVAMRHAASWLDGCLQLGRDVFARGVAEDRRTANAGDVVELLRACLVGYVCQNSPQPMCPRGRRSGASPTRRRASHGCSTRAWQGISGCSCHWCRRTHPSGTCAAAPHSPARSSLGSSWRELKW